MFKSVVYLAENLAPRTLLQVHTAHLKCRYTWQSVFTSQIYAVSGLPEEYSWRRHLPCTGRNICQQEQSVVRQSTANQWLKWRRPKSELPTS